MKRFIGVVVIGSLFWISGCSKVDLTPIQNKLDGLEKRVIKLEKDVKILSTKVDSLEKVIGELESTKGKARKRVKSKRRVRPPARKRVG